MKTKDIIVVIAAVVLIGVSGFFIYRMIAPTKSVSQAENGQTTTTNTFTGKIDEETLKLISEKKDYGEAALDNIGRTNPFGSLK